MNAQHCGGERELEWDGCANACRAADAVRLVQSGWCGAAGAERLVWCGWCGLNHVEYDVRKSGLVVAEKRKLEFDSLTGVSEVGSADIHVNLQMGKCR